MEVMMTRFIPMAQEPLPRTGHWNWMLAALLLSVGVAGIVFAVSIS
jgi:hypothetical protein